MTAPRATLTASGGDPARDRGADPSRRAHDAPAQPRRKPTGKQSYCAGCRDDFYNGNNPYGIRKCWALSTAKIVRRVRVYLDERPPWNGPVFKTLSCRHERGAILISPEARDKNNAAARSAR